MLNAALSTAVQTNRRVTAVVLNNAANRIRDDKIEILSKFKIDTTDLSKDNFKDPDSNVDRLSLEQYLQYLSLNTNFLNKLSHGENTQLLGVSFVIPILMKLGASTTDLREIFCENCDFSGITFPYDTHFEYAILRNSRFVRAILNGAKFNDADLSSASFFGAILTNANLSQDIDLPHADLHQSGRAYQNYNFPFLECANLIGADLTGLPLGELQVKLSGSSYPYLDISVPALTSTKMDASTILKRIAISAKIVFSYDYVLKHAADQKLLGLTKVRSTHLWNDPLRQDKISLTPAVYSKFPGDFTDQNLAAIEIRLVSQFNENTLTSLGGEAFHLRGFFNQPSLQIVPLFQQFSAAIKKLDEKDPTKISKAESEKAAAYWAKGKPNSCDDSSYTSPMFSVGYDDDPGFDPHELDAQ